MKKFITIALAVAVLFSFAACQQAYKVPTGFSVSATKTAYIEGDVLDLSTITGVVEYSDGSTKTVSGAEFIAASTEAAASVPVSYGEFNANLSLTIYGVDEIEALSVTLPETLKKGASSATVDGTATLPDGSTVDVKVALAFTAISANVGEKVTPASASAKINEETTSLIADQLADWKVTVGNADDFDAKDVKELVIEQVNNTSTDGEDWVLDTVSYKVYAVDNSGNRKELAPAEYTWKDGNAPEPTYQLKKAAPTGNGFTAIYNADPSKTNATAFKYGTGKEWVTDVKVVKVDPAPSSIGGATEINASTISTYYDFTVEWAGGADNAGTWNETVGTTIVITNPTVPAYGTETGEATAYEAAMMLKYGKADTWHPVTAPSYDITKV